MCECFSDYQNSQDLHIGVTTSSGMVMEIDRNGVHRGERRDLWGQCLVIDCATDAWSGHWDTTGRNTETLVVTQLQRERLQLLHVCDHHVSTQRRT